MEKKRTEKNFKERTMNIFQEIRENTVFIKQKQDAIKIE